jgi:hypothetical protein
MLEFFFYSLVSGEVVVAILPVNMVKSKLHQLYPISTQRPSSAAALRYSTTEKWNLLCHLPYRVSVVPVTVPYNSALVNWLKLNSRAKTWSSKGDVV